MSRALRTLLFSSLYPSSVRPGHGIFIETRLRELLSSGLVETKVVAPVPWFYSTDRRHGDYALMARTPLRGQYQGVDVSHPRYLLPPKVGMTIAPLSMALGSIGCIRQLIRDGFDFDLVDAHYFYPDGVAAALVARWIGKPYVVTARGSDLHLISQYRLPRSMMQWAARNAAASIGVARALVDVLSDWGLPQERLHVMRNGIDLERFIPVDQTEARRQLGLQGAPILLSVGRLVELKGHHIAIEALREILVHYPNARLVLVGQGVERSRLEALAAEYGVSAHVFFAGARSNTELKIWYSAADLMVLASSREGWANVLLESMACGTPVVAMRTGGTPEVVQDPVAGLLVDERSAGPLAAKVIELLRAYPDRSAVRHYAEGFSWQATTDAQLHLFAQIAGRLDALPVKST